ncbi:MAG: PHP domain-containing protein [Bdellovibrionota bacterium]|nr:PHP domain-containing protein [Bdellovibrionota bacterium]
MKWCDFHIHTNYSDGELSLREVVDLYGKAGFSAIAITDHLCDRKSLLGLSAKLLDWTLTEENFTQYLHDIQRESLRARLKYNMLVIPGVEITYNSFKYARSAHILALGITKFINPDQDIKSIFRDIRKQGALSVAAHPVSTKLSEPQTYYLWNHRDELRDFCDLWEVASGSYLFEEVMSSDLAKIANSDFHIRKHFSSWKTVLPSGDSWAEVKKHLLNGNLHFKYFHEQGGKQCLRQVLKVREENITVLEERW